MTRSSRDAVCCGGRDAVCCGGRGVGGSQGVWRAATSVIMGVAHRCRGVGWDWGLGRGEPISCVNCHLLLSMGYRVELQRTCVLGAPSNTCNMCVLRQGTKLNDNTCALNRDTKMGVCTIHGLTRLTIPILLSAVRVRNDLSFCDGYMGFFFDFVTK